VKGVYNVMSFHMANPDRTEGRRFICKIPAIEAAYEELKKHVSEYWNELWGMDFELALEREGKSPSPE